MGLKCYSLDSDIVLFCHHCFLPKQLRILESSVCHGAQLTFAVVRERILNALNCLTFVDACFMTQYMVNFGVTFTFEKNTYSVIVG